MAAPSTGETDLSKLLATLTTVLHPASFVFATIPYDAGAAPPAGALFPAVRLPDTLQPILTFHEAEGLTVITTQAAADAHALNSFFPCRMITLNVHSSLEAVGFMAVVATRLAAAGISTNPVSGYFHDAVFVPVEKADAALAVLEDIRRASTKREA